MSADLVKVLVEIPKGSRNTYERNPETGELELDRRIFASVAYPTEYGCIAETVAGDGDALDALVAVSEPTFPGCVVRGRPVAVLRMHDDGGDRDPKVLVVPERDPAWSGIRDLEDVPRDLQQEIEHFFRVYGQLRGDRPHVQGWGAREEALRIVRRARAAHDARRDDDGRTA